MGSSQGTLCFQRRALFMSWWAGYFGACPTALTDFYSERQYKYRFNRFKKLSADDYVGIDHEVQRRAALGKKTVVFLHDRLIPPDRLKRGIDGVQKSSPRYRVAKRKEKDPGRINFRTPSLPPVAINKRALSQVGNSQTSQAIQELENVSSTEPLQVLGGPSTIPETQSSLRTIELGGVDLDDVVDQGVEVGK